MSVKASCDKIVVMGSFKQLGKNIKTVKKREAGTTIIGCQA